MKMKEIMENASVGGTSAGSIAPALVLPTDAFSIISFIFMMMVFPMLFDLRVLQHF